MFIKGDSYYAHWDHYFPHPTPEIAGNPIRVKSMAQEKVPGKRQSWDYEVTYANGSKRLYNIPCPSLPVTMNSTLLESRIGDLTAQKPRHDFVEKLARSRENVMESLASRGYEDNVVSHWEDFFDRLPQTFEASRMTIGQTGSLWTLRNFGDGKMRFKDSSHLKPRSQLVEYIDTINYNGHAIRRFMNREIEESMRIADRTKGLLLLLYIFL